MPIVTIRRRPCQTHQRTLGAISTELCEAVAGIFTGWNRRNLFLCGEVQPKDVRINVDVGSLEDVNAADYQIRISLHHYTMRLHYARQCAEEFNERLQELFAKHHRGASILVTIEYGHIEVISIELM